MKKLIPLSFLLLASLSEVKHVYAQTVDPTFAPINILQSGTVYNALQQPDGKYLVAGNFTQVNGNKVTGLARLNADGSLDDAFTNTAACQSVISKIRLLPNGQILLQGETIIVGGRTFNTLAKLNADGSVVTDFTPGTGPVNTVNTGPVEAIAAQADGKILVGGTFTSYNGVPTNRLVRLNVDGSVDEAFTSALSAGFVRTSGTTNVRGVVVQPDGKILVCGDFQNYNGTGRSGLVRLNANGSLDTSFNPVSSTATSSSADVLAVALDPRTNYVVVYGNSFSTSQIVRLTTSGQLDPSFALPSSPTCLSFSNWNSDEFAVDANGRVIISGCFANYGVTNNTFVTRFLANGQPDSQFAIGKQLNERVYCVKALTNGEVLLGGAFGRYGSIRNVNLLRLNDNAQALSVPRAAIMLPGSVQEVVQQTDGKLLVGGRFWQINGQAAGNLARLNQDGSLDPSFQLAGADGSVRRVLTQPDGRIVIGGEFTSISGQTSPIVARLLADGSADPSFAAPTVSSTIAANTSMYALALQADGNILVAGPTIVMGGYSSKIHRLLPNGSIDVAYASKVGTGPVDGSVLSIATLPTGKHYIGSSINFSGGTATALARLNVDGSTDNSFAAGIGTFSTSINKVLVLPNNQLLVGGSFNSYNGVSRANLVRLNSDGTVDGGYTAPVVMGTVSQLLRYTNGRVLLGSTYSLWVDGTNRGSLVRLNPNGSYDASFTGSINSAITALALQSNEAIVVGGTSVQVNGQDRTPLARLIAPNVLSVSNHQSAARIEAWPSPAHEVLQLSLDASARPQRITLVDALGKTVHAQTTTKTELTLPVQHLPGGVYLLRVDYADGPVTRRIVIE